MRISVAWISDTVTAVSQLDKVRKNGVRVRLWAESEKNPFADPELVFQELSFEASSFREGGGEASTIESHLRLNHNIQAETWINGKPLGYYVCQLERKVEDAAHQLKATRGWLRDRRIAEIRQKLEQIIP